MRDRRRNRLRYHAHSTGWGRHSACQAASAAPALRNSSAALALMMLAAILAVAAVSPGFRSPHVLQDHYSRFGKQFGNITIEQYLHLAQQLRDATPGRRHILVSKRPDGGGSKFDVKRGWFVAFDGDGTLRTFFVPKDGIRYFEAQQKSSAPPE